MPQANTGDTVQVHYTGTLSDGSVFDSSASREPLEFTLGQGQVIPGFEDAVTGMEPGESKTVTIPAMQAYGPVRAELVAQVPKADLPDGLNPEVGHQLGLQLPNGQQMMVLVTAVSEDQITLDANHPLAGKDLTFKLDLVAIT